MSESRSLSVYDRMADPLQAVKLLGNDIAHSGMFGCDNEQQGRVMAMTCMAKRLPPMELAERYHVIHGRLSMKSEAMLADFLASGGKHKIICRTHERVTVELSRHGDTQTFDLSWVDAQREPFPYEGKEKTILELLDKGEQPPLKAKYKTPRSRMQMLWARLVSDAVRAMDPQIVTGSYTPEEISDFDELPPSEPLPANDDTIIESEVVTSEVVESPASDLDDSHRKIAELFRALECPASAQTGILQKRGAASIRDLDHSAADELIAALEARRNQATSERTDGPANDGQVMRIKAQVKALCQQGGEMADLGHRIKAKLEADGINKLENMSYLEARSLENALERKEMEAFFNTSLEGYSGN